jgi:hypothetical protein
MSGSKNRKQKKNDDKKSRYSKSNRQKLKRYSRNIKNKRPISRIDKQTCHTTTHIKQRSFARNKQMSNDCITRGKPERCMIDTGMKRDSWIDSFDEG